MTTNAIKRTMGVGDWTMVIVLSLIWGGSFVGVGVVVKELPTFTIVACRIALAALALWMVVLISRIEIPRKLSIWRAFLIMGVLNNAIPFCLIVWGQIHITSGLASTLNATTPLFTVIVAQYLTRDEKMTGLRVAGVLVGFFGVAVMIGGSALGSLDKNVWAQFAILGAALSYAFASVFGRRFKDLRVNPIMSATGQITASSLLLMPVMLLVDQPWTLPMPSSTAIASLIGLAVLATSLAYILFFRILEAVGATNLSIVTFLVPVSAIVLGIGFLDETLETNHVIGMALIGLGLAFIDGRLFKRLKK